MEYSSFLEKRWAWRFGSPLASGLMTFDSKREVKESWL
jgi:hypothetical protein